MTNTLYIQTDSEPNNWLSYIFDEFKSIHRPQFEIKIVPASEELELGESVIYYSKNKSHPLTIPNCSDAPFTSEIKYIEENIFVLLNTIDNNDFLNYDLLWNAFVFLSRKEEYESERRGKLIYSYKKNHPRKDKESFKIPIVNHLFIKLEQLITNAYPLLVFEQSAKPIVELSHDLDYINKTIQLRLKQTVFNSFNTLKSVTQPSLFFKELSKTFSFFFKTPSYWCFDYWKSIENNISFKSVFYIYANSGQSKSFKSWLIDPSYDVKSNKKLQQQLKEMNAEGFKIGLHGSYNSALEPGLLQLEKEVLIDSLDFDITKTRQHWLNFKEGLTPYFHNELFKEDSTLAWNDSIGFRCGSASKHHPYDHKNDRPFDYEEIPQTIMDSNIYDYAGGNMQKVMNEGNKLIKDLQKLKNVHVALSWHPRTCSSDYNWHQVYEVYLQSISNYESI